ncbi:MAG: ergothioneine biosynthesis protein EgtC [Acidimicrobiales bacterium]
MCRHLAYVGPPRTLASLLYEPPHSLEQQSWKPLRQRAGAMNADGWGVGWWDPSVRPEPARYRTAAPMWTDRSFRSVAEVVRAGAFMAAVRSATPPSPIVETGNAPFVAGEWLFSLNGYVREFRGPVGHALRGEVSERRSIGIDGSSDSEVLFALALDALDDGASPEQALAAVITNATKRAESFLNLMLHDGHTIVATTWGNSLSTLQGAGLAEGGVLVASEPLDERHEWVDVPDHHVVRASGTEVQVSPLSDHGGPS